MNAGFSKHYATCHAGDAPAKPGARGGAKGVKFNSVGSQFKKQLVSEVQ